MAAFKGAFRTRRVKGNAIGAASFGIGLELGDNARVTGKCVTGGGSIDIVPQHPAKCRGGKDTSGSDPLLTEFNNALDDAGTLAAALSALTPTLTQSEIDVRPGTKLTMTFPTGVNVVKLPGTLGRMLIESGSKLTNKASKGSSVIFLIGGLFTTQSKAKVVLAGGIKAKNVAYVVDGDVTLGTRSSVIGTMLAPTGSCMLDHKSALTGAIICESSVTFEGGNSVTFAPLPADFSVRICELSRHQRSVDSS